MLKSMTAAITALSLTFATMTPAYAQGLDREDVGKLIIGLAAAAVIGSAIEQNRNRAEPATPARNNQHWNGINRNNGWSDLNRQEERSRQNRRTLPYTCLRRVETRFGTQRMFGKRCLENNYRFASRLPDRCAVRVWTSDGPRNGFDPLCLREQGYRTDRRN